MLPPLPRGIIINALFSTSSPTLVPFVLLRVALSFVFILKPLISPPKPASLLTLLHHRRRLKPPPTMDHTPTTAFPSSPLAFSSPESLSDWLSHRLPPGSLASWGSLPGTKTLNNLYLELSQGETTLLLLPDPQPPTPLRVVRVVTVRVRNRRGALLVESRQLLSDGSVRPRNRPLSEKMRPGEPVQDAALRAVREELGDAAADAARIVPGSCHTRVEERSSASFPGLPAHYVLYSVDAEVGGLPEEGEFSTEEAGEGLEAQDEKAIFVRRHFWKWIDDDRDDGNASHLPA